MMTTQNSTQEVCSRHRCSSRVRPGWEFMHIIRGCIRTGIFTRCPRSGWALRTLTGAEIDSHGRIASTFFNRQLWGLGTRGYALKKDGDPSGRAFTLEQDPKSGGIRFEYYNQLKRDTGTQYERCNSRGAESPSEHCTS